MSDSYEENIATIEPKNSYLNLLIIKQMCKIQDALYDRRNDPRLVIGLLRGLIDYLDEKGQEHLAEVEKELLNYEIDPKVSRIRLEELNRETNKYLSRTWLSQIHLGIVPASSLPSAEKQPREHKPVPKILSPRLE